MDIGPADVAGLSTGFLNPRKAAESRNSTQDPCRNVGFAPPADGSSRRVWRRVRYARELCTRLVHPDDSKQQRWIPSWLPHIMYLTRRPVRVSARYIRISPCDSRTNEVHTFHLSIAASALRLSLAYLCSMASQVTPLLTTPCSLLYN